MPKIDIELVKSKDWFSKASSSIPLWIFNLASSRDFQNNEKSFIEITDDYKKVTEEVYARFWMDDKSTTIPKWNISLPHL